MKDLMQGLRIWKNPKNKFVVLRLHYTADEDKRSADWKAMARAGTTEMDWNREMEINFDQFRAKRCFPEYNENFHYRELTLNPFLPVYRSWDFGYRHPFVSFHQIDENDTWLILYEIMGTDIELEKFIPLAQDMVPAIHKFKNSEGNDENIELKFKDFCDPAGTQKSDKSARTSIEILKAFNIHPVFKRSAPVERARLIRSKLLMRPNKIPGLLVNTKCPIINSGFMGGFHFMEDPTPGREDEPEKEGFYEHCVVGETLVETPDGAFKIKDLAGKTGVVKCYDVENKEFTITEFSNVKLTRKNVEVLKITLEDNREIILTPDHRVLTQRGWVEAQHLTDEDDILDNVSQL